MRAQTGAPSAAHFGTPTSDETAVAVLAALPRDAEAVAVRDGERTIVAAHPQAIVTASGSVGLDSLDRLSDGWWAGWLAYDLGRAVERVEPRHRGQALPDLVLGRFDARLVLAPGARPHTEGEGPGLQALERALSLGLQSTPQVATQSASQIATPPAPRREKPHLGPWRSSLDQAAFVAAVGIVKEHIRAGNCYQVNLTRQLEADGEADAVGLFDSILRENPAPHAAFIRLAGVSVVSASPERFLHREGEAVETRPIKGTGSDPHALLTSAKDRAENVMIVDLARNDLGRVCRPGTIRVESLCGLERHPGLWHLVSTVRGRLRTSVRIGDLVRATFPPASITGAPKPRVMQIIEDVEPVRRGIYCGAVGWMDPARERLDLNVAIRTFVSAEGRTSFGVGGGIVADSDPEAEWRETLLKSDHLMSIAGARAGEGSKR